MNKYTTKDKRILLVKLVMILILLISSNSIILAQTTDIYENEGEVEENEDPQFLNEINKERFKSNFDQVEESKRVDYSTYQSERERHELNVFGKSDAGQTYQYNNVEAPNGIRQGNNANIVIDGVENWQQSAPTTQTPNSSNVPSVKNPFAVNPTVKAPRNMDAVPDNGDDPSDIPLDGGIVILSLTAAAFGMKKKVLSIN